MVAKLQCFTKLLSFTKYLKKGTVMQYKTQASMSILQIPSLHDHLLHWIANFQQQKNGVKKYLLLGETFPSLMMTSMIDTTCITPLWTVYSIKIVFTSCKKKY